MAGGEISSADPFLSFTFQRITSSVTALGLLASPILPYKNDKRN
jgi:hypothetical protein